MGDIQITKSTYSRANFELTRVKIYMYKNKPLQDIQKRKTHEISH